MTIRLAVCAIVRDEARDIEEWLAFHQLVGVEHFIIYDNGSTDGTDSILSANDDVVESIYWPGECQQLLAYEHALRHYGPGCHWMAFIDADEFLFSPSALPLPMVLEQRFGGQAAVGVCWAVYGTSGVESRDGSLVTQTFRRRAARDDQVNLHIKSIVRPEFVQGVGPDPHHFLVPTVSEDGQMTNGPFARYTGWGLLRINHYWSKSLVEAAAKAGRHRADNGAERSLAALAGEQLNEVEDPILYDYGPLLERRLRTMRGGWR